MKTACHLNAKFVVLKKGAQKKNAMLIGMRMAHTIKCHAEMALWYYW